LNVNDCQDLIIEKVLAFFGSFATQSVGRIAGNDRKKHFGIFHEVEK